MILLKSLVKNLMGLWEPRYLAGTKKLWIDVKGVSFGNTPMRGVFSQGHLSRLMAGYPNFIASGKALTTAIYVASLSRHGLIELNSLWVAKTPQSNELRLDVLLKSLWSDLGENPSRQDD
jgi:hypothetical protein